MFNTYYLALYVKYDRYKNGLTYNQFFDFFDRSYELWEPLYKFRLRMIGRFFPDNSYLQILNRKKNILAIKEYRCSHNNKFPPKYNSCLDTFLYIFSGYINPNEYHYDYQLYQNYTYTDYTRTMIRKYNCKFNSTKMHFKVKHLKNQTGDVIINQIDEMYINFHTYGMRASNNSLSVFSSGRESNNRSSLLSSSYSNSSCSSKATLRLIHNKKSILRGGSSSLKVRHASTQRKLIIEKSKASVTTATGVDPNTLNVVVESTEEEVKNKT